MNNNCKIYCCEYYHDGSWWALDITAYDWADAEVRSKKLSLQLKGEHYMTIPANPGSSLFVRGFIWLRNVKESLRQWLLDAAKKEIEIKTNATGSGVNKIDES